MATRSFRPSRRRRHTPVDLDALVRQAAEAARARRQGYRERSLALHGWICAKCAREFDRATLHLLTVHHKDGNHEEQPAGRQQPGEPLRRSPRGRYARGVLGNHLTKKD
jgi:hypothetical protein